MMRSRAREARDARRTLRRGAGGYAIVRGPVPEALDRIVDMHDSYYGSRWGFGPAFTQKNMTELSEFLGRFDPDCDGLWTARVDGPIEGSVAIDGSQASVGVAELRWFLVSDALRGQGPGRSFWIERSPSVGTAP